jgi:transcriptional regulator with XRE-family HTH domain
LCNTNNYDPAIIAEKIKQECMRQNITVKTMLQELNINHAALTKMTHGGAPSYITVARICDYLNISIDTLLNRPAPATPAPEPVSLTAAIDTVAAAAHISPDALRAVLHLPINDK